MLISMLFMMLSALVFLSFLAIYRQPKLIDQPILQAYLMVAPWFWLLWLSPAVPVLAAALVMTISHGRVVARRYGPKRRLRILQRTWYRSGFFLLAAVCLVWLNRLGLDFTAWLSALALLFSARAAVLAVTRANRYAFRQPALKQSDNRPTVSICIPARNETHALTDALRAAVASSYEKIEILVLDDCSQDSTPDIIRSFAHDGVRFIQGTKPASGWLGKNYAYDALLNEASGDLILFCGVDVHLAPQSVEQLVARWQESKHKVISVMPYRRSFDPIAVTARSLRYYWELAVAPWPAIGSCWMVERDWLLKHDGFKKIKHSPVPERQVARLARHSHASYSFVISNYLLGITVRKRPASVRATAVRTLYPQVKREPLFALALTVAAAAGGVLMLAAIFGASTVNVWLWLAGWLLLISHLVFETTQHPTAWPISTLLAPFNWLLSGYYLVLSMVLYEFGTVEWKGRNICLPVMHQRTTGDVSASRVRI